MYEVGVVSAFHASHSLKGDFGSAREMHSHDYRVEVAARGLALGQDGTLVDMAVLERSVEEAVGKLDGRKLNDLEVFLESNSTAEAVARHLFDEIAPALFGVPANRLVVTVWESAEAYARYEGDISGA